MPLSPNASAADWIADFVHSKNPKFKGLDPEKRRQMGLAAYYGSKEKTNESTEQKLSSVVKKKKLKSTDKHDAEHKDVDHNYPYKADESVEITEKIHPKANWHLNDPDKLMSHVYWIHGRTPPKDLKTKHAAYQGIVRQLHSLNPAPNKRALDRHMNHYKNQANKALTLESVIATYQSLLTETSVEKLKAYKDASLKDRFKALNQHVAGVGRRGGGDDGSFERALKRKRGLVNANSQLSKKTPDVDESVDVSEASGDWVPRRSKYRAKHSPEVRKDLDASRERTKVRDKQHVIDAKGEYDAWAAKQSKSPSKGRQLARKDMCAAHEEVVVEGNAANKDKKNEVAHSIGNKERIKLAQNTRKTFPSQAVRLVQTAKDADFSRHDSNRRGALRLGRNKLKNEDVLNAIITDTFTLIAELRARTLKIAAAKKKLGEEVVVEGNAENKAKKNSAIAATGLNRMERMKKLYKGSVALKATPANRANLLRIGRAATKPRPTDNVRHVKEDIDLTEAKKEQPKKRVWLKTPKGQRVARRRPSNMPMRAAHGIERASNPIISEMFNAIIDKYIAGSNATNS